LGAAAAGILPILHQKILLYGFYIRIFVCNPALRDNLRGSFGEPPRREGREEIFMGSF